MRCCLEHILDSADTQGEKRHPSERHLVVRPELVALVKHSHVELGPDLIAVGQFCRPHKKRWKQNCTGSMPDKPIADCWRQQFVTSDWQQRILHLQGAGRRQAPRNDSRVAVIPKY